MSLRKFAKLICVSSDNNNKFYIMEWDGISPNFQVEYGRVESTSVKTSYPISKWNTKYNEKLRKNYKDVTDFVSVTVDANQPDSTPTAKTGDMKVDEFIALMKAYTDNLVSTTYSVKAEAVSQKQVDAAQFIIDELNKEATKSKIDNNTVNLLLTDLYTTIPRRMGNVKDYLLPNAKLDKILIQEQDNLDAMASQVAQVSKSKKLAGTKVNTYAPGRKVRRKKTFLEKIGVTMKTGAPNKDIQYLLDQQFSGRVHAIFEVNKPEEDENIKEWMKTRKDQSTKILIHGTRCTSVLPILEQGLKIRPAGNFQFSGKAYGNGNYFSEVMNKSLNYVGHDKDKVLLVYEVHTGNPFVYNGWYTGNSFSLNLSELTKRGYDSTYVKAGNGLLNSEIIAYSEKQNRIKYIIWLKG